MSVAAASAPDLSLKCIALHRPIDIRPHDEELRGMLRKKQIQHSSNFASIRWTHSVPGHTQTLSPSLTVDRYVAGWEVRDTTISNDLSLPTTQQIQHPTSKKHNLAADRTFSRPSTQAPVECVVGSLANSSNIGGRHASHFSFLLPQSSVCLSFHLCWVSKAVLLSF